MNVTVLNNLLNPEGNSLQIVDSGATASVSESVARHYGVVPVQLEGEILTVAVSALLDVQLRAQLSLLSGFHIREIIVDSEFIEPWIGQCYGQSTHGVNAIEPDQNPAPSAMSSAVQNDFDSTATVNAFISSAIEMGASDIHIEPFEGILALRYRIDGVMQSLTSPPWSERLAIVSRLKVLADMDIAEKRRPQDGKITFKYDERSIDLRMSTTPTAHGEKVVLRVLDKTAVSFRLDGLGLRGEVFSQLELAIEASHGLILITGPTGSGKTTTLYAALNHLNTGTMNILTVEDPIEYELPGINQTQVHPEIGLTFDKALRSFLRQDPDVILVGEIRDRENALIAVEASLTGHLVLSSLHTSDSPGAIGRLFDLGVEPFLVASALRLILTQRLVRMNCSQCIQEAELTDRQMSLLGIESSFFIKVGTGCPGCFQSGYRGRMAITEILPASPELSHLIGGRASTLEIRDLALQSGLQSLRDDGLRLLRNGITSPSEVIRATT
ncbi:MAG: type II/IV secretion system protein [Candidatus Latescibacteria bacterium]|nr:type II/IV secretion system protein [Candidatus Latescibacterota bacterium]